MIGSEFRDQRIEVEFGPVPALRVVAVGSQRVASIARRAEGVDADPAGLISHRAAHIRTAKSKTNHAAMMMAPMMSAFVALRSGLISCL